VSALRQSFEAGMLNAYKLAGAAPVVRGSKLLGGNSPTPSIPQPPADPISLSKQIGAQQVNTTAIAPERKLAGAVCTTCRHEKHYGPCRQTQKANGSGVALKHGSFNPGMYGDRRDSNGWTTNAHSLSYNSATSDPSPSRGRQDRPEATASTAFSNFNRNTQPADEWGNATGALVKTCANRFISRIDENKTAEHTATLPTGDKIDIEKLYGVVNSREPTKIDITKFKYPMSSQRGFSQKRLSDADTTFPVMFDESGHLVDGRHRVTKLKQEGKTEGLGHLLSKADIATALIKKAYPTTQLGRIENRGPTVNPYEQAQPQFTSPPVGMGPIGSDAISKAFDQFKSEFDTTSIE